jgi:hypothetical protein
MKIVIHFAVLSLVILLGACQQGSEKNTNTLEIEEQTHSSQASVQSEEYYLRLGDSITKMAQKTLLSRLSTAIESQGTKEAIFFCNEKAFEMTDSFSSMFGVKVSRIAELNRNPNNVLNGENDWQAWSTFSGAAEAQEPMQPQLIEAGNQLLYYKAITMGSPVCLACHGDPKTQIEPQTLKTIQSYYPSDKAQGFALGDLRGAWKVVMQKPVN